MSIYCYDTEFLDDGSTIELISIGIVCDDGREYYAVNSDMDTQRIGKHQWLMDNVWPHLPLRGRRESTGYVGSFTHELMQEIQRVGLTDRDMPCTTAAHDALADARWNLAVARQLGLCGAKS